MDKNLESILEAGVHANLKKRNSEDKLNDFLEDIKKYKKNNKNEETLPFVNQEKTFKQIARVFSTQYPYVVLVGEPGIGKSMILNYVSEVLTGKKTLKELRKVQPETVPLFEKIIAKVNNYERLNYLCLPNLQDPMNVTLMPYSDESKMYEDNHLAACFCDDVAEFVNDFINENPKEIKYTFTEKQMRSFFKDNIHTIYTKINNVANDIVFDKCKEYKDSMISLIDLNLVKEKGKFSIDAKWNLKLNQKVEKAVILALKEVAGFSNNRINISLEELENGLANTIIPNQFSTMIDRLYLDIEQSELSRSKKTSIQIFEEEFNSYKNEIDKLKKKYNSGKIKTQQDLLDLLNKKDYYSNSIVSMSDTTLDYINNYLKEILLDYKKDTNVSKEVYFWMESVVDFFKNNRNIVRDSLNDQYAQIREFEDNLNEDTSGKEKLKDPNSIKDKKKSDEDKKLEFCFEFKHGRNLMSIHDVLETKYIICDSATDKGITCNKIGSVSEDVLFGSFSESSEELPPHMTIDSLGNFFKGGILLFQDSFGDFIKTIVSNDKDKRGMREQFLEYLQTGTMSLVQSNGITYNIKSPKIILGCCNEDPFKTIEGIFVKDESGLRSRIKTINVPSLTLNSEKSRQGSLSVLYGAITSFNKSHSSKLELDDETASLLLNLNVDDISGYVDLRYRSFVQNIEDLCAYAISKNETKLTSDLIKDKIKETLPLTYFSSVDSEKRYGSYFNLSEKCVGHVCGLSTSGDAPGVLFHVNSQFIPGFEQVLGSFKRFKLVDVESAMTDETTFKGYELVKDYVQNILGSSGLDVEKMKKCGNWKLKTHFGGNWNKMGGPSASMATTVSVVSAFTGDPIYKNRFMTGTIDPMSGECGVIGGTYLKSLIPYRLKEITKKLTGNEEDMYFLFPIANKADLEKDLLFDPFDVKNKVTFLPIVDFAQAYLLSTCGKKITKNIWESSLDQKDKVMKDIYFKINNKFN